MSKEFEHHEQKETFSSKRIEIVTLISDNVLMYILITELLKNTPDYY